jgi:hypothetical protein
MHLQIREVVLWPRNPAHGPRRLPFELGAVNVITGASKTGKSAIIPIIDYCLGSDKCTIPVTIIRDACSWFGVVVSTDFGDRLLARREPGAQKGTGDMFVLQGLTLEIPNEIPEGNTNVDKVKADLNELVGLTQLSFDIEATGSGFLGRPSFRDLVAFNFQPQSIVANPNVVFYKADTHEHRQKLRTIFPYVLGAVTPETLALQHELERLRLELRRRERQVEAARQASDSWVAEIQSKVSIAREMGLLEPDVEPTTTDEMLAALQRVVSAPSADARVTAVGVASATDELEAIQREESTTSSQLTHLKRRLADMNQLRSTSGDYQASLIVRRERLQLAEWIKGLLDTERACPMCGSGDQPHANEIEQLNAALQRVEAQTGDFDKMPAAFDREHLRVRAEIDHVTDSLEAVRIRRRALENWAEREGEERYSAPAAARFLGGLEEALRRYASLEGDGELTKAAGKLRERIAEIESRVRSRDVHASTVRALQRVTSFATRVLPKLDIERPNDPIALVIEDLTVKVYGRDREDFLWEVGSGANWLGYHVAMMIALHQLFDELPSSPVPSFTVFDQPSQVYFPKRSYARGGAQEDSEKVEFADEDVLAVRKVFSALAEAVTETAGRWQVLVLDHAADDIWGNIEGIRMVEEWRDGRKLVPEEWLVRPK